MCPYACATLDKYIYPPRVYMCIHMYTYVYMCIYMARGTPRVYVYICIYVVCIHAPPRVYICIHMYIYVALRLNLPKPFCHFFLTHPGVYVYIYVYIYTYVHIPELPPRMYMRIYKNTYVYVCMCMYMHRVTPQYIYMYAHHEKKLSIIQTALHM